MSLVVVLAEATSSLQLVFRILESPGRLIVGSLAIIAATLLVIRLLHFERQLVPRGASRCLLAFRLILIVMLAVALAEPAINLSNHSVRRGRVVIALDRSASMTMTDGQATAAERLAWARGLGLIGNARIDARLDRWEANLVAGVEPEWVDDDETKDPVRRAQLARSRQEILDEVFASVSRLSRSDILERLTGDSSALIRSLKEVGDVEFVAFGASSETLDASARQASPTGSVDLTRTNLAAPLSLRQASDSTPVTGIVILSDGRHTAPNDPLPAATQLGAQGTPIFAIPIGSTRLPRDLSVATIDAPRTVFGGDTVPIIVRIRTGGFRDRPVVVSLEAPGTPGNDITQTIHPNGDSHEFTFRWPASRLGRQKLVVRVEAHPDETRTDNNEQNVVINVVDDVATVLLLDSEARWEFRFIDNALSRDQRVDLSQVVFTQPFLGVSDRPFFDSQFEVPTGEDPVSRSVLADADLLIVGDLSPERLGNRAWDLIEQFVSDAGGTLVMVADKTALPSANPSDAFQRLMPVEDLVTLTFDGDDARGAPTQRGFGAALSGEGQREPMLQFHLDPVENRRIWDGLPGHTWGLVGQARPGTSVWARPSYRSRPARDSGPDQQALFVHQFHGLGQVLWLGIDSTWRWRHRTGDTYHHRFWGQLARWAARNKAVSGDTDVRLGVDSAEVAAGDPVTVTARWRRGTDKARSAATAQAAFFARTSPGSTPPGSTNTPAATTPVATIPLSAVEGRSLQRRGRTSDLPPGDYRIRLVTDDAALDTSSVFADIHVHPSRSPELDILSADHDRLAQLATASRGRLVPLNQLHTLPALLTGTQDAQAESRDMLIWNHWLALLLFLLLMTCEWVVRKIHGLP